MSQPTRMLCGLFSLCLALQVAPDLWAAEGEFDRNEAGEEEQEGLDEDFEDLEDEFALLEEDSIVYSASKHRQDINESPVTITVITRAQIENTHCNDIVCLLRYVPEMEVRRYRPLYLTVGARALGAVLSDKGLVLIDGREVNVEAFGMPFWAALPIHLDDIERIEVIRGPGSALYGANAHSLVVSITTRRAENLEGSVYLGAGEHATTDLHARVAGKVDDWRFTAAGGLETSGAWNDPGTAERKVYRARLTSDVKWAGGTTSMAAGISGGDGTIFATIAPITVHDLIMAHAQVSHSGSWLKAQVWFQLVDTDLELQLPLVYKGITLGQVPDRIPVLSTSLDSDVQLDWSFFDGNLLIAGINYRWLTYISKRNDPQETNQHRLGLFVQDEQRLFDQLHLTAGVRLDYNSITPFTVSPRVASVWRFLPSQLVRISFGMAFRKPSFFNTSIHVEGVEGSAVAPNLGEFFKRSLGNEKLDNESVSAFELGYRGSMLDDRLTIEANAFFNMYRSNINFVNDMRDNALGLPDLSCPPDPNQGCNSVLQFRNEGWELNTLGGSVSATARPTRALWLHANYTYKYTWYEEDVLDAVGNVIEKAGDKYRCEPDHLANLLVRYRFDFGLRLGLSVHLRSGLLQLRTPDGGLFGERIWFENPLFWFVGTNLSWRIALGDSWLEAGLKAFNPFNKSFRDITGIDRFDGELMGGQLMGRWVMLFTRIGI